MAKDLAAENAVLGLLLAAKQKALESAYGRLYNWCNDIDAKLMPYQDRETLGEVLAAIKLKEAA